MIEKDEPWIAWRKRTFKRLQKKCPNRTNLVIYRAVNDLYLSMFPKPAWADRQLIRENGLVEDLCVHHGIGHPNAYWMKKYDPKGKKYMGVHGCCGECGPIG
jgi:hypothetical protein